MCIFIFFLFPLGRVFFLGRMLGTPQVTYFHVCSIYRLVLTGWFVLDAEKCSFALIASIETGNRPMECFASKTSPTVVT